MIKECYNLTVVFCQDYESSAVCCVTNDAVPAEVDETHSHMQPVVEKQESHDVCCVIYDIFKQNQFMQIYGNRESFSTVSLWPPNRIGQAIIFCSCGFYLFFFLVFFLAYCQQS